MYSSSTHIKFESTSLPSLQKFTVVAVDRDSGPGLWEWSEEGGDEDLWKELDVGTQLGPGTKLRLWRGGGQEERPSKDSSKGGDSLGWMDFQAEIGGERKREREERQNCKEKARSRRMHQTELRTLYCVCVCEDFGEWCYSPR